MSDDSDFDSEDDFESDDFDPTDERDPTIRELRLEIVRLEARVDQLMAADAERAAEMEELRQQIAELRELSAEVSRRIDVLEQWRKKMPRRMISLGLAAALIGTVAANVIVYLLGW